MIHPIVLYGDPILRRPASPVTDFGPRLERLASDMIETMYAADGIGLAAPQVGVPLRVFVALEVRQEEPEVETAAGTGSPAEGGDRSQEAAAEEDDRELTQEEKREAWGVVHEHVMVNPRILAARGSQLGRDGCLSLPGLAVDDVPRSLEVDVEYQDLDGGLSTLTAQGYFAHVIQHEQDHLDGVLFFDRLPATRRQTFLEENRALLAAWQREALALAKERERVRAPAGSARRRT